MCPLSLIPETHASQREDSAALYSRLAMEPKAALGTQGNEVTTPGKVDTYRVSVLTHTG